MKFWIMIKFLPIWRRYSWMAAGLALIFITAFFTPEPEKEKAFELYSDLYSTTQISHIPWNGSISSCNPGEIPKDILRKAETRINYFRKVTGLNPITLSDEFNKKAQYAALMMTANNQISHTPSTNWKCFTREGFEGARNSNIGISDFENFPEISFITGFILDYGPINHSIGHRKWLLNSRAQTMGYGATGKHEIIYVTGVRTEAVSDKPEYIAYPPPGYFPYNLIFEKWSFAIPYGDKANFEKAKVEMIDDRGKKLSTKILSTEDPWYFDPTIVWQADDLFSPQEIKYVKNNLPEKGYLNKTITVRIRQVTVNEEKKDFEYFVIPFDPEK